MTAIIVWFFINGSNAAFCTQPMSIDEANRNLPQVFAMWQKKKIPGLTPPNIITSDHANYDAAMKSCKQWMPE